MNVPVTLTVNGEPFVVDVDPHRSLLRVLRDDLGLTGTKEGCDDSECGACTVLVDGRPTNACSWLAVQTDGAEVTTVEGLPERTAGAAVQRAFLTEHAVQCGFCIPGMLVSATALLERDPSPGPEQVRAALAGNLCRCTGYTNIVRAVTTAAGRLRDPGASAHGPDDTPGS